ncbi:hypothetical protein JW752_05475 [Candidatus Peregrinibacteria bacterium]|nr:hypothetical protein [Candidatus Peregrinibacteria bacterium]
MAKQDEREKVVVQSGLYPYEAIRLGAVFANVREHIVFLIDKGAKKDQWKITLVRGTREDLLKAIEKARGVTLVN